MLVFTIPLQPITKKNSQQLIMVKGRPRIIPSKQYIKYERECARYMPKMPEPINHKVNVKAIFFMGSRRRVDLVNLQEALCDVLVHHGVLADDNMTIVWSMDGSFVSYDKENPRTEVTIEEVNNG